MYTLLGKPGVGKSSLARAFLSSDAVEETVDTEKSGTMRSIQKKVTQIRKVTVHVYDTRGLFYGDEEFEDDFIIAQIIDAKPSGGFDIIVVCMKFYDRFDRSNKDIFRCLPQLQAQVWSRVHIALTQADELPASLRVLTKQKHSENFESTLEEWKSDIIKFVTINIDSKFELKYLYATSHVQLPLKEIQPKALKPWLVHFVFGITKATMSNDAIPVETAIHLAMTIPKMCISVGLAILNVFGITLQSVAKQSLDDLANTVHRLIRRGKPGFESFIKELESIDEQDLESEVKVYETKKVHEEEKAEVHDASTSDDTNIVSKKDKFFAYAIKIGKAIGNAIKHGVMKIDEAIKAASPAILKILAEAGHKLAKGEDVGQVVLGTLVACSVETIVSLVGVLYLSA